MTETSGSQLITAGPEMPNFNGCGGCFFVAATVASAGNDSSFTGQGAGNTTPATLATPVVFTAYSITSVYLSSGTCITDSYEKTLTSPFSAVKPASYLPPDYPQVAEFAFQSYLGFETCNDLGVVPVEDATSISPTTSPPSSTPSTAEPHSTDKRPAFQRSGKIGIGIGVPTILILFCLLVLYFWRSFRKKHVALGQTANAFLVAKDGQPYLQEKAELEDEARRKHELEAQARVYELNGDDTLHEISAVGGEHAYSNGTEARQELRGAEHAQELGNADV
ncbi:MAG: hypothetical protein Q9164_007038 [Protoblastenia rupestris]